MTPELVALLEPIVGPAAAWTEHTQDHGVTRVFRAADVWVKAHRGPRKYRQELTAYQQVVPRLSAAGIPVPTLLAHHDDQHVLVISHVPGAHGEQLTDRRELHREAGRALAILHALPCDVVDPLSVAEALVLRLTRWTERARPHLPASVLDAARERLGDGAAFQGVERCWCHRDFTARNWLLDGDRNHDRLGLIDFEHTMPDLWHVDLVRLAGGDWLAHPETRDAFFEAHPPLSPEDAERLELLMWVQAVSTVAWAEEHEDHAFAVHARALLDHLGATT